MLKIRLSRRGKRHQPTYRIVVAEHTAPIKGRHVDVVGIYIPSQDPKVIEIDRDKVDEWIKKGAQPTPTVASLLKKTA